MLEAACAWKLGSLALKLLAGASKVLDHKSVADFLELGATSAEAANTVRERRCDVVQAAAARLQRRIEQNVDAWLRAEFGADPAGRDDATAAIAALDDILPKCLPDSLSVARANLDAERIAGLVVARAAAGDELFRAGTFGERMLRRLVREAYEEAKRDREFAALIGIPVQEVLLERTADIQQQLAALAAQVGAEKGVPLPVLREILARLGDAEAPLDAAQIERRLRSKADEYRELRERRGRLGNDDPRVQELRREADRLIDEGDFDRADAKLSQAEAIDLAAVEELESIALRRRASAAASRGDRAAAARLRLDYRTAAAHFAEAAKIVAPDKAAAWDYRQSQARALYDEGSEFGDNEALREAIATLRSALDLSSRDRVPLDWAGTQNNLGNALMTLGERESGTARLEEAVAACRAALEERTRDRVPLDWAMTQTNLGNALQRLGERESGTARLEEAVAAYRAALEERTRERAPLDWAGTQNNLGNALRTLGERESGTARLEEAAAACRAALQEFTRERVPLDWAGTQNNLGNTLARLGQRESGTARLEEAVAAYHAALEERTRERVPLDWATTQNNLGNALRALGERESGT
ncbi:MAG TPA: tetratricopeptide repeat protein, partial [Xanthobacteraceae bacterium]